MVNPGLNVLVGPKCHWSVYNVSVGVLVRVELIKVMFQKCLTGVHLLEQRACVGDNAAPRGMELDGSVFAGVFRPGRSCNWCWFDCNFFTG